PHAGAVSAEPPRVLHHWVGVWVCRFFGARGGLVAPGYDRRGHGCQTRRIAAHAADRCCVHAAQRNARAAHWFLVGALAGPAPDPGTFPRPICSLHDFAEFSFAPDAALRFFGPAGIPAPPALLGMVSAFACGPRPSRSHPAATSGIFAECRSSPALPAFVQ